MCSACSHERMGRTLHVRDVPDDVHAKLKARAAAERTSLSDYVARELTQLVQHRTTAEILEEARERGPKLAPDVIVKASRALPGATARSSRLEARTRARVRVGDAETPAHDAVRRARRREPK